MRTMNKGFTLIELIVVIAILGILAAVALPRFINVSSQARSATVQGVAGGLRSAVALARAQYYITPASPISMNGVNVTVITAADPKGQPTGDFAGIGTAMGFTGAGLSPNETGGLTVVYGATSTFQPSGGSGTCQASYVATTGVVTVDTSGC